MSFIYEARITQFSKELKKNKQASFNLAVSRLVIFCLIIAGIYLYWGQNIPITLFIFLGGAIFLKLVVINGEVDQKIAFLKSLIQINEDEKLAVKGSYQNPENGEDFLSQSHEYAHDFDLFGLKSFFSKFNRTVTLQGTKKLAHWLTHPVLEKSSIIDRQKGVQELVTKLDWRQEFLANGMLNQLSEPDQNRITSWHELDNSTWRSLFMRVLLVLVPTLTLVLAVLTLLDVFPLGMFGWYLLVPLTIAGSFLKSVNKESNIISNLVPKFEVLANLTEKVETEEFDSKLLNDWKNQLINADKVVASAKILELKSLLGKFDQRSNMLIGIALNALLLWDLQLVYRMNKWKINNSLELAKWLDVVGSFDALISLANMSYNHSDFEYPSIAEEEFKVCGKDMKHPMLGKEAVGNDFCIAGKGNVNIVTGANMAGKSTFLRTVGLNMVLGMMGAPVPVKEFKFSPMMIFSSMRTEDSLAEQTSFFYAELSRLAKISDILKSGKKRFVILDEILKGTNSHDKARGSYAFVEKMIQYNMMGLIATHDLSLCELANKHPAKIENKSFEVEFVDDELVFDYKLQNRVCQNMNASFLLKKMGIVDHY